MKKKAVWFLPEFEKEKLSRTTIGLMNEAICCAKKILGQVEACLIGYRIKRYIDLFDQSGVDAVYLVEHELLSHYTLDAYTHVISELIKKHKPSVTFFGDSPIGNELAARVAVRTRSNCVIQAESVKVNGETFCVTKSGYNDKVSIHQEFLQMQPLVLSMSSDHLDIKKLARPGAPQIKIENADLESLNIRTKLLGSIKGDPRKLNIEEADRIVSVGRGLRPEQMPMVQKLADLLGATIGGTRPAVDDDMIAFERQIGITGKSISPDLIFNIALSGAREFTSGIEHSSLNIAVNSDKNAPIFKIADVCAVGDAKEIITNLITMLEQKQNEPFCEN